MRCPPQLAATQFPTVSSVVLLLDGERVTTFGGEGIVIDHPLTRADFEEQTPAILVETPAPFDEVVFPLRLTGTANVFEAVFMIRLTDAAGTTFYEQPAMATSGTGTRGTFDITIEATPAAHGTGIVRLWEPSARDGSDTNVVEYPVEM